jgi:predicted O-methyltransferase YrrM
LPAQIDLVLMDGFKPLYPRILELVEPHLRVGAVLVADNMEAAPAYAEKVRAAGGPYESVAFSDGVEVTVFTGT